MDASRQREVVDFYKSDGPGWSLHARMLGTRMQGIPRARVGRIMAGLG